MTKHSKNQYRKIQENWAYIKRYNDSTRCIAKTAQHILFSALYQINKCGHAVLTHHEISKLTNAKHDQNGRLVNQLRFVLDLEFKHSIIIDDTKYTDCYIFSKNENTDEILENPRHYFKCLFDGASMTERFYEQYKRDLKGALQYEKEYLNKLNKTAFKYLHLLESKQYTFDSKVCDYSSPDIDIFLKYVKSKIQSLYPELAYRIERKQCLLQDIAMEEIGRGEVEWIQA